MKRSDFIKTLQQYPEDYEKFCLFKDNFNLYRNLEVFQLRCATCNSSNHQVDECPLIHYVPDKLKIIKNQIITIFQARIRGYKRKVFRYNSIRHLGKIQISCDNFIKSYNFNEESQISEESLYQSELSPKNFYNNNEFTPINNKEVNNFTEINGSYKEISTIINNKKRISQIRDKERGITFQENHPIEQGINSKITKNRKKSEIEKKFNLSRVNHI